MPEVWDDPNWPPGTVRLEVLQNDHGQDSDEIVLQPRPTKNPNDPLNWPRWRKDLNFALAALFALMVAGQVNATTPTWGPLGRELNFDDTLLNDTYAIGCATMAVGAVMLIPFALKYGLRPVYVLSCAAQLAVMVWAARTETAGDWWGVNAVQCWLGALGDCLVQMTVSDVFFIHQRGVRNSIYVWASAVGTNLFTVAAGFITSSMGWRWVWWWFAIGFGLETILMWFGFEESKFNWRLEAIAGHAVDGTMDLEAVQSKRLEGGDEKTQESKTAVPTTAASSDADHSPTSTNPQDVTEIEIDPSIPRKSYWQRLSLVTITDGPWSLFLRHSYQPFMIMCTIPGIAYVCATYAILLAWGTVMSAALSTYMLDPPYNFDSIQIGLMNLATFIGNTLGSLISGPLADWIVLKLAKRNNGIYEPEMRLWALVPFIPFQIAGPFWFGYALEGGQSWVSVAFALGVCSFGQAPIQSVTLTYMLDAYNEIIGDALVALTFSRSTLSTVFVFAMTPWIAKVGMSNVFNTIGAIGIAVLLFVFVLMWKGKQWRFASAKSYQYFADRQLYSRPIKEY